MDGMEISVETGSLEYRLQSSVGSAPVGVLREQAYLGEVGGGTGALPLKFIDLGAWQKKPQEGVG
jgi:hypothetical protein